MDWIELLKAAIIGIIEGITEWLPISSTGHMILADEFIKLNVSPAFWEMFLVVIQLGAICAVIVLFFHKLNPFSTKKTKEEQRKTWILWAKVLVGCIPAAFIGILFDSWFEEHFFNPVTVSIALVIYGIAFIIVERVKGNDKPRIVGKHSPEAIRARVTMNTGKESKAGHPDGGSAVGLSVPVTGSRERTMSSSQRRRDNRHSKPSGKSKGLGTVASVDKLDFGRALCIGVFQCLAIVPGTSRSGSTILGGRILGVNREAAAEFSFFLAIPVMFGWSLLKLVKAFIMDDVILTSTEWGVFVVGIVVAFLVSILAIRFLMGYIRRHSFEVFGWYRIVLGVVVLTFFAVTGQLFVTQ